MKTIWEKLLFVCATTLLVSSVGAQAPLISYSALIGGTAQETVRAVAVNKSNGDIFVAGNTRSAGLATSGAFQTNFAGGKLFGDGFVARFDSTGSNLIYFTYFGGTGDEAILGMTVLNDGTVFVTGTTTSTNLPAIANVFSTNLTHAVSDPKRHLYSFDGFFSVLSPDGSTLGFSLYLGGPNDDQAVTVAADNSGNAYVAGFAGLVNFPTGTTYTNVGDDVFVVKIGSSPYTVFFGGNDVDHPQSIGVDGGGNAFVTGYTRSQNFPTTTNAFQTLLNGKTNKTSATDAFVTRLDASGGNVFSTLLGGAQNDYGFGIALDSEGSAYVTGRANSTDFPTTTSTNSLLTRKSTTSRAFLTKLSSTNAGDYTTNFSVVFGGRGVNEGISVAVDAAKNAYVVGTTTAKSDFPTNNVPDISRGKNAGSKDVFVTKFDATGTNLLYSFYLGGSANDLPYAIDVFGSTAYVAGKTFSSKFPQTNGVPRKLSGKSDGFITIVSPPPAD